MVFPYVKMLFPNRNNQKLTLAQKMLALRNGRVEYSERKWELVRLPDTVSGECLPSFSRNAMHYWPIKELMLKKCPF